MGRLNGKIAVITGAGDGIGRAISMLFANEGARIAVTDINPVAGEETVRLIREQGGTAQFWQMNVGKEAEVERTFTEISQAFGAVNVLINNAGIIGSDLPTDLVSEAEWDRVFDIDVKGVFFCTKHAIPQMRTAGGGSIVNLSSIYGLVGSTKYAAYHAAKGAVTQMTKRDAVTYGKEGIRVNSIHPGTIVTPLVQELMDKHPQGAEGYAGQMLAKHPIGHLGEPRDIAYGALYLASDESRFVAGAQLVIDGGYTAQ